MKESMGERLLAEQVKQLRLPTPLREHPFAPPRRWRFDFAWITGTRKVAVEVEGGSWIAGRHTRGSSFEADCEKYAEAALAGWIVLRVTTGMVEDGRALLLVRRALHASREHIGPPVLYSGSRPILDALARSTRIHVRQPRIRLAEDRAWTLEFCRCGRHPRLMSIAALMRDWRRYRKSVW